MIKAVLFDLDGTLIDSADLIMASFRHAMTTHGQSGYESEEFRSSIGTPLLNQFSMYSKSEEEIASLIADYSDYYRNHRSRAKLFSGVAEALDRIKSHQQRLAIVTSKSHVGAARSIEAVGIQDYFEFIVGCDDVTQGKPQPEPVYKALDYFDIDAKEAVFIGDSPHDIEAGKRAGVATIGVTWGPYTRKVVESAQPDLVISSFDELSTNSL